MKCLYAVPSESAGEARLLSAAYAESLESLSSKAVMLSDDLRTFAESSAAATLKLDDEDWEVAGQQLERSGAGALVGELYWSSDAVLRAREVLDGTSDTSSSARELAEWLASQVRRDRVVVLLVA
jgi:hypothetical protein